MKKLLFILPALAGCVHADIYKCRTPAGTVIYQTKPCAGQLDARLRYRIKEGNLTLWYEPIRPRATIGANVTDTVESILESISEDSKVYWAQS